MMKETNYLIENEKIIEEIKKIPVFGPFTEEELHTLLHMSKLRVYKPGETIIKESEIDSWIYFLIYGKVKISKEGKEITQIKRRGDIFGEMRFIDSAPRSASANAAADTVCLAIDAEHIESLTGENKIAFGYILYRIFSEILAERLRIMNKELIRVKGKEAIKVWEKPV
jgi:CRP/FNR family transcriptional regulator, cyclic AMP receptor protein